MKSHSRLFNKHLHPKKLQAAFLLTQGLFPLAEQFCFMHSFTTTGFLINTLVWIILQPWVLLLLRVDGFIQACVSGKQKKKSIPNDGTDLRLSPSLEWPLSNPTLATYARESAVRSGPASLITKKFRRRCSIFRFPKAGNPGRAEWKTAGTAESNKISGEHLCLLSCRRRPEQLSSPWTLVSFTWAVKTCGGWQGHWVLPSI